MCCLLIFHVDMFYTCVWNLFLINNWWMQYFVVLGVVVDVGGCFFQLISLCCFSRYSVDKTNIFFNYNSWKHFLDSVFQCRSAVMCLFVWCWPRMFPLFSSLLNFIMVRPFFWTEIFVILVFHDQFII